MSEALQVRDDTPDAERSLGDFYPIMAGFDGPEHLTNPVDTNRQNQKINAMEKSGQVAENQPRLSADDVQTHSAQYQTDEYRKQCLGDIVATQSNKRRKCKHHQCKFLGSTKSQCDFGQGRCKQRKQHHRYGAANKRGASGSNQRLVCFAGKG